VVVVAEGQVVAAHARSLEKRAMVPDPLHHLAALGRKPGAPDHAPVFRDWELPPCFAEPRAAPEGLHGRMGGPRRFVRVLQLMSEHPLTRVGQAVAACLREHLPGAGAVIQRTRSLAAVEAVTRGGAAPAPDAPAIPPVQVPLPDLGRFDALLSGPAVSGPVSVSFA
jgi:hypothetical protein